MSPAGCHGDVVDLLMGARHWLAERGLHPEWPRSFTVTSTLDRIHDHQVFLTWHDTTPVGTITLDYQPDPDFWPDAADAGYVYRLAVDRAHTGQHIGALLLDWAGDQIAPPAAADPPPAITVRGAVRSFLTWFQPTADPRGSRRPAAPPAARGRAAGRARRARRRVAPRCLATGLDLVVHYKS